MKPDALEETRAAIRAVVEANRAKNARVFGSVLRGEDDEDSDLDILVDPVEETTLFDLGAIRGELSELLGVKVDILTPMSLPEKFREKVISEAKKIGTRFQVE